MSLTRRAFLKLTGALAAGVAVFSSERPTHHPPPKGDGSLYADVYVDAY